ncbi:hypothetical protein CYLTODRAFT_393012 [Cylindrobasidium torrendii FP15055 ss-10]|uniref:Queuosine 5'-phosphate N-glycosylase/hydrolase n=1 Tax=Cylindrobasidium torrendii FP15055 ss-10 TaxID=1314674 RepID=A0A0D7BII8_9AGAR|nr:hypothetical protein CYLTODRAFT_393012 [Cylindrobasidium torrendii FP15055 ss-10]
MATPTVSLNAAVPVVADPEKRAFPLSHHQRVNPVVESAQYAYQETNIVQIDDGGVARAAKHIHSLMQTESYSPRTWRTHPLHMLPNEPHRPDDPHNKAVLDWVFLISALNFSFWSEKEGTSERYGVEWQTSWDDSTRTVYTGYWSLVAALNRAIRDDGIPITTPSFYADETLCPDSVIANVFRRADQSTEDIPLLEDRIRIMREVGRTLCERFNGSYSGLLDALQLKHNGDATALDLVHTIIANFPSFRDEHVLNGRKVCIWKRAQILVADTWAAFYPASASAMHPLFPGTKGPQIHDLTMFADYRVPQILHHLNILTYPPTLIAKLEAGTYIESGSAEELSLRASSIVAVERVRDWIIAEGGNLSSVVIDFFLWDLAKRIECGEQEIDGIVTQAIVPPHRTRSIWY